MYKWYTFAPFSFTYFWEVSCQNRHGRVGPVNFRNGFFIKKIFLCFWIICLRSILRILCFVAESYIGMQIVEGSSLTLAITYGYRIITHQTDSHPEYSPQFTKKNSHQGIWPNPDIVLHSRYDPLGTVPDMFLPFFPGMILRKKAFQI